MARPRSKSYHKFKFKFVDLNLCICNLHLQIFKVRIQDLQTCIEQRQMPQQCLHSKLKVSLTMFILKIN